MEGERESIAVEIDARYDTKAKYFQINFIHLIICKHSSFRMHIVCSKLLNLFLKLCATSCCVTEEHRYVVLLVTLRQAEAGFSALTTGAMTAATAVQTSL